MTSLALVDAESESSRPICLVFTYLLLIFGHTLLRYLFVDMLNPCILAISQSLTFRQCLGLVSSRLKP